MNQPIRTNAAHGTFLWILLLAACPVPALAAGVEQYNLTCDAPAKDSHGAIPLGNGDIGISAWAEESGDLLFYVSKTDAYDDNHRLLKLGRVRVKYPSLSESDESAWARVVVMGGGKKRGMCLLPEVGDEVVAEVEVVRTAAEQPGSGRLPGMGLRFLAFEKNGDQFLGLLRGTPPFGTPLS